jgi:hypothetical protein
MCSQRLLWFNFYLINRGNATIYPLFAFYEGLLENSIKGNGIDSFQNVSNCYILASMTGSLHRMETSSVRIHSGVVIMRSTICIRRTTRFQLRVQ